jgi:hypothetical protein
MCWIFGFRYHIVSEISSGRWEPRIEIWKLILNLYCNPLLGKDRETNNETTAVARQQPARQWTGWVAITWEPQQTRTQQEKSCVFYWSVPRVYKRVEYLHRDPASRRRRRKGKSQCETVKYGHESYGTRTREWLHWQGPAASTKDGPVFSSERVPHKNETLIVKQ